MSGFLFAGELLTGVTHRNKLQSMIVLPSTPGFLPQDHWDCELKLCHELWVRGITSPTQELSEEKITDILTRDPMSSYLLKLADNSERKLCASLPGEDCNQPAVKGKLLCERCAKREEDQMRRIRQREERIAYVAKKRAHNASHVTPDHHPWKKEESFDFRNSRHPAILKSHDIMVGT